MLSVAAIHAPMLQLILCADGNTGRRLNLTHPTQLPQVANVKESKLQHTEQPQLFLAMHIAQNQLAQGQTAEARKAVEEAKDTLASLNDVSSLMKHHQGSSKPDASCGSVMFDPAVMWCCTSAACAARTTSATLRSP